MKKTFIVIINLFVLMVLVSGCTNPDNDTSSNTSQYTGPYKIGNATFNMPEGWVKKESPTTGVVEFWKGNDPRLKIEELNPQEYESKYAEAKNADGSYEIKLEKINISGVEVKVVRAMDTRNGDIFYDYFFQKNGKYYQISAWDYTNKAAAKSDIENAVNIIITTLKTIGQNPSTNTTNTTSTNNQQTNNTNNNNNNNGGGHTVCPVCGGDRVVPSGDGINWISCPNCGGTGYV